MKWLIFLFIFIPLIGCQQHLANHDVATSYTINYEPKKLVQQEEVKKEIMLDVPLIKQNPELKYGCEVTSTAMILQYAGVPVNKMELYKQVSKDPDPIVMNSKDIVSWGNPAEGFVGDMTGKKMGYAVFDEPIEDLINQYLEGKAINLTNMPFSSLLTHVGKGFPIVIWTTGDYKLPNRWESWDHQGKTIKTPLDLHVVVLVGYDQENVYLNDPLSGVKQAKVNKEQFIQSWEALEKRAVSYKK
ncbi:MAG TPA: C39 family peptidase [Bacillus sp. (in: firmicutes)]|uniref:C39 family peptidase n=1 Tax=Bacillus litorisediminis TaxID=2922713 RepID=UPI001FAB54FD|nr:C39 family peptidase [Bacillus litorisediminis]HWO74878.1 C39 family peptidase [Bacillus sp. (in: firmicutes)]